MSKRITYSLSKRTRTPSECQKLDEDFQAECTEISPEFKMTSEQELYHLIGFFDALFLVYDDGLVDLDEIFEHTKPLPKDIPVAFKDIADSYRALHS